MTIAGRCVDPLRRCAAARPTFTIVSGVIGSLLATPRIPSVPKSFRITLPLASGHAGPSYDDWRLPPPPISTDTWTESAPSTFTDFPTDSSVVQTAKSRDRPSMLTAHV